MNKQFSELLPEEAIKILKDTFKEMKDEVVVEVFLKADETDQFSIFTKEIMKGFSGLTDKIKPQFYKLRDEAAKKRGITRAPAILISPDKYKISYIGSPSGEEGRTLIMTILAVSNSATILSEEALKKLFELKEPRHIQVFVSPTCPYCPQQALNAVSAAIAMPKLITAEIIEMYENKDYIEKYHIVTVPFTVVNDIPIGTGVRSSELFVEEVLSLSSVERVFAPISEDKVNMDVVIIGGGPAGLTAGIYAGRSGLKAVILEKATAGGQVLVTPVVENYPGFSKIAGKTLVDITYQQALQYAHIFEGEGVLDINKADDIFEVKTNRRTYIAKGVIIATGAEHKKLNVSGEKMLSGRGVSYCATCDGYFFKDGRKVIVVGGGSTAVTDALYMHSIGANVSLVHRGDQLRAEAFLQKALSDNQIPVYWNTVVEEIYGVDTVTGVKLRNVKDGSVKDIPVDAVFIAIGYVPNNEAARMIGLELDEEGYIRVDAKQRTYQKMVYAAGDVTGGAKQIATAVGQGAIAAISTFEDIAHPYWKRK